MFKELIKLADYLDQNSKTVEADFVDHLIRKYCQSQPSFSELPIEIRNEIFVLWKNIFKDPATAFDYMPPDMEQKYRTILESLAEQLDILDFQRLPTKTLYSKIEELLHDPNFTLNDNFDLLNKLKITFNFDVRDSIIDLNFPEIVQSMDFQTLLEPAFIEFENDVRKAKKLYDDPASTGMRAHSPNWVHILPWVYQVMMNDEIFIDAFFQWKNGDPDLDWRPDDETYPEDYYA